MVDTPLVLPIYKCFTILPNFRKTCHEKFSVLQTYVRPNTNCKQLANTLLNAQYSIIHNETPFLTHRLQYTFHSYTHIRLLDQSFTLIPPLFPAILYILYKPRLQSIGLNIRTPKCFFSKVFLLNKFRDEIS